MIEESSTDFSALVEAAPTPTLAATRDHLNVTPEPSAPADRKSEVARWVVTLSEPLIATKDRAATDEAMAAFINRNSDWACAFFAGLLSDLASLLPAGDPWSRLSATIDLNQIATGQPATVPEDRIVWVAGSNRPPSTTGATIDTGTGLRAFGTSVDAFDLTQVSAPDIRSHPGAAAVASNLSPVAAAFVAIASGEPRHTQVALAKTFQALWTASFNSRTSMTAGHALLLTAGQAVQWLIFRRRQYLLEDDGLVGTMGLTWISKADRVNAGKAITLESNSWRYAKLDDSAYEDYSGPGPLL